MKKQLLSFAIMALATGGVLAQTNDTIAKVKASGEITMGVRESAGPLSYTLGDGKYTGYHYEVCQRIIANLEKVIGRTLKVTYQSVTSQNRIPLVMNGTVDIECGATNNSAVRQKDVAFVLTTYVTEVRIVVKANSGITSLDQLNGKRVATTAGTTSVQLLRRNERANNVNFDEVVGKDHAQSFSFLETGHADAFVMDGQILASNVANSKSPGDYRILGDVLSVEPTAIMLRKDDPAFKKLADDTVRDLIRTGELAKMYDKWFVQPIPPNNIRMGMPASAATKAAWADPNDRPLEDYLKK